MSDNVESLALEQLRAIRADMADFRIDMRKEFEQVRHEFGDMKKRFRSLEHHVTGLRRDEAVAAGEITDLRHTIDGLLERLEKLEARTA